MSCGLRPTKASGGRDVGGVEGAGVTPKPQKERLTLIVGREQLDEFSPPAFIVGALNTEFLNQLPEEDAVDQIESIKRTWTVEPEAYHWREIECDVSLDKLEEAFRTPLIEAEL